MRISSNLHTDSLLLPLFFLQMTTMMMTAVAEAEAAVSLSELLPESPTAQGLGDPLLGRPERKPDLGMWFTPLETLDANPVAFSSRLPSRWKSSRMYTQESPWLCWVWEMRSRWEG